MAGVLSAEVGRPVVWTILIATATSVKDDYTLLQNSICSILVVTWPIYSDAIGGKYGYTSGYAKEVRPEAEANRSGKAINIRIPDELRDALDRFIEAQRIPPKVTDVVEVALQEFLSREGFSLTQE